MKKIFIIEDDVYLGRMYERAFTSNGYSPVVIKDGISALNELVGADDLPAAILLDILVPKMSGLDLLRHIKEDPKLIDIPTAILTNSFREESESVFRILGADAYWVKADLSAKDLVSKTEELIRSKKINK